MKARNAFTKISKASTPVSCSNGDFGGDPAPMIYKYCMCEARTTLTQTDKNAKYAGNTTLTQLIAAKTYSVEDFVCDFDNRDEL